MTDEEKKYALALGRHLRMIRAARGLTQSQAAQLYRQRTGKHGAGLIDLECGRSAVLPLLKLRFLKELYEVSYDDLLEFDNSNQGEKKENFSKQLNRCIDEAHEGRPYSLFFHGDRYVRRIFEHENMVEISVLSPDTGGCSRDIWPREAVDRFSHEDFGRQFSRLTFRLTGKKEAARDIQLIRAEKRSGKISCRIVDGSTGISREEIPVCTPDQLLRYLEGYQRLGYEVELTGFIE